MKINILFGLVSVIFLTACLDNNKPPTPKVEESNNFTLEKNTRSLVEKTSSNHNNTIIQESVSTGENSVTKNSLDKEKVVEGSVVQRAVATGKGSQAINAVGSVSIN